MRCAQAQIRAGLCPVHRKVRALGTPAFVPGGRIVSSATEKLLKSRNSLGRSRRMSEASKSGGELFIVDNSDESWKGLKYLQDWTEIATAFDIATGYFEIGALLALDGNWQKLD